MGYGKVNSAIRTNTWWAPDFSGVKLESNATDAVGPKNAPSDPVGPLTAQYNAVWAFIGHGSGPGGLTGKRIKFQEFETGDERDSWLFTSPSIIPDTPSRIFLDRLPMAYKTTKKKPTAPNMWPLGNSRLMIFAGCWTADSRFNSDLPRVALAQGAKCAIGFEGVYYTAGLSELMVDVTSQLKEGKTFGEVETFVQNQLDHWHRGSGPVGNMTGRDENNDPYKISLQSTAKSATLRTVIDSGPLSLPRTKTYYNDARWGWE